MRFNIVYFASPEATILRRDIILLMKYSLEDCGHEVTVSSASLEPSCINIIMRGYAKDVSKFLLQNTGKIRYGIINTEVIADGKLNFFIGQQDIENDYSYEKVMQQAEFVWEVIYDNMERHKLIGSKAYFFRWGYHPLLEDIRHLSQKDYHYYFFGSDSPRRREFIGELKQAGYHGAWDKFSSYLIRNSNIARAKLQLNIISHDVFTHVNSFRICYLAGNRCAIISEPENDPVGYMDYTVISPREHFKETMKEYLSDNKYVKLADKTYELFRQTDAKQIMHDLLNQTFGSSYDRRTHIAQSGKQSCLQD